MSVKFEKVMIIDDNQIDRYITSRTITKNNFGCSVLDFSDARDALAYLEENQHDKTQLPEIIFVDIYMPIMSGFEFLEAYTNLSENVTKHCRTYIISSTIDTNDILKVQNNPDVISFHQKPLTKEFLLTIS